MRKILTSVLSVAGLLAVTLALASSPAAAVKGVVEVRVGAADSADNIAGTYTVSWETAGGCDPGTGTSGASGSITLTVAALAGAGGLVAAPVLGADSTADQLNGSANQSGGLQGNTVADFVSVDDSCTYEWSFSMVEAVNKASCVVAAAPALTAAADTPDTITLTITGTVATATTDNTGCAGGGSITVTVRPTTYKPAVEAVADDPDTTSVDESVAAVPTVPGSKTDIGAIRATTFTVTAEPVANSNAVCTTSSAETELNAAKRTIAKVNVVADTAIVKGSLRSVNCRYNVTVQLPDGFAAGEENSNAGNKSSGAAGVPGAAQTDDGTENAIDLYVTVNSPTTFLVQTVNGDSHSGTAQYQLLTDVCAAELPAALTGRPIGGINSATTVELREGRFNITSAVATSATEGKSGTALDDKAVPCHARATVSNLPDHCVSQTPTNTVTANLSTDANANNRVILEFTITCTPPPEPPEPEPEPVTDMGNGAEDMGNGNGAEDMGNGNGAEDMGNGNGAEDMGADDMDNGAEDMGNGGDMGAADGPPVDNPTG